MCFKTVHKKKNPFECLVVTFHLSVQHRSHAARYTLFYYVTTYCSRVWELTIKPSLLYNRLKTYIILTCVTH